MDRTVSDVPTLSSIEEIGLDMFDAEAISRPHRFYALLRERAPIVWSEQPRAWVLTRYEDVKRVLRDHETFSSARGEVRRIDRQGGVTPEQVAPPGTLNMLGADRPDHTRLRTLLRQDFIPSRISRWQPRIEQICDETLQVASSGDSYDVVKGIAEPLPVTVIAEMLGIPSELGHQFKRWSDAAIEPVAPTATDADVLARNSLVVEFRNYLQARSNERRYAPTEDLIGRLVAAGDEGSLTDAEVLAAVNLLLLAGNETTTNLISNAVLALALQPDKQHELRQNPELIERAVEEFLRYDGSVQYTTRIVNTPQTFYGQTVPEGDAVIVSIASANRDPRVFENPDVLNFNRPIGPNRHIGFGDWIHICLGQFLARIETRAALRALLAEFDTFELACQPEDVPYRRNFNLRGPRYLPIREIGRSG